MYLPLNDDSLNEFNNDFPLTKIEVFVVFFMQRFWKLSFDI